MGEEHMKKGNNRFTRLLSFVMVLALVLALLPTSAFTANAVSAGETIYLKPNSNWVSDNAWFAAYFFGSSGEKWITLSDSDNDGYYEGTVPTGTYGTVIFCRMNPSSKTCSWDYCWNQTLDLVYGTNNCYTIADGAWSKGNGTWSVYKPASATEPEETEPAQTEPAGSCKVTLHIVNSKSWPAVYAYAWMDNTNPLGSWPGSKAGLDSDGFYTISFTVDTTAGQPLGYVINNGGSGSQSVDLSISADQLASGNVELWIQPGSEYVDDDQGTAKYNCNVYTNKNYVAISPEVDGTTVTLRYAGKSGDTVKLYGSMNDWKTAYTMTANSYGIFSYTFTDMKPGTYEYKFVVNGSWITDPVNGKISADGNSTFMVADPNAVDNNKVTIKFHYARTDGNYSNWNLWVWGDDVGAGQYDFSVENGERVTSLDVDGRATQYVCFIPRYSVDGSSWAIQE
jgi:plastocyanin